MIACLDVCYDEQAKSATAAGLLFSKWDDDQEVARKVVVVNEVEDYLPGEFYRRELPCLLAVLKELPAVEVIIVDGHVWLEGDGERPGLGAHLHTALGGTAIVVGVAKRSYKGAASLSVTRGESREPLWVSAMGMPAHDAADLVRSMHGPFRIPTLLKRVDGLCRGIWPNKRLRIAR